MLDDKLRFRILDEVPKRKATDVIYVSTGKSEGSGQEIPLWMFGLLY